MNLSLRSATRRPGFTLIELLVVISIIALLIGILLPVLGVARETAYAAQCAANQRSLGQANANYLTDHGGYFPQAGDVGGTTGLRSAMQNQWYGAGAPDARWFVESWDQWFNFGHQWTYAFARYYGLPPVTRNSFASSTAGSVAIIEARERALSWMLGSDGAQCPAAVRRLDASRLDPALAGGLQEVSWSIGMNAFFSRESGGGLDTNQVPTGPNPFGTSTNPFKMANETEILRPSKTVLFADKLTHDLYDPQGPGGSADAALNDYMVLEHTIGLRHGGAANVAFADGSVRRTRQPILRMDNNFNQTPGGELEVWHAEFENDWNSHTVALPGESPTGGQQSHRTLSRTPEQELIWNFVRPENR